MNKLLSSVLFGVFVASSVLPAFSVEAQIPTEINTTTCRCAVVPSLATLAVSSIAVEHVTNHILVAFNQPVEVKSPVPNNLVQINGFKLWKDGLPISFDSLGVNSGEMDLAVRIRPVDSTGKVIDLLPTSNIEIEYTPQADNVIRSKFNTALTLGPIAKQKVVEGTVNDRTCPMPLDYRMNGYNGGQDGSVFTFPVTEPLRFGSVPLEVTVNGAKSVGNGTAIGVTAGALSLQNLWPVFTNSDSIVINPSANKTNGFKDLNGNALCGSNITLRPLNSAFAPQPPAQPVKPEIIGFSIEGNTKAFTSTGTTANRNIPTWLLSLNVPVTPSSVAYFKTANGIWVKFVTDPTNPHQMKGSDVFGQKLFQSHHKGTLDIVAPLMINITAQSGEKLTNEGVQNAIKNNNVSKNGAVFVAIENYEALTRKAARRVRN